MKVEDLQKIRERTARKLALRSGSIRVKVIVSMGTSGIAAGAGNVLATFIDEVRKRKLRDVLVTQAGERGLSSAEPVVEVREVDRPVVVYGDITPEKARRIVTEHIVNGNPVSEYAIEVRPE